MNGTSDDEQKAPARSKKLVGVWDVITVEKLDKCATSQETPPVRQLDAEHIPPFSSYNDRKMGEEGSICQERITLSPKNNGAKTISECESRKLELEQEIAQIRCEMEERIRLLEEELSDILEVLSREQKPVSNQSALPQSGTDEVAGGSLQELVSKADDKRPVRNGMSKEKKEPTKGSLLRRAVIFYFGIILQIYNLAAGMLKGDYESCVFLVIALVAPCVFQAWHIRALYAVMKKEGGTREALIALCNLNRAAYAIRQFRNQPIEWVSYQTELVLNLTWATSFATAAQLKMLLLADLDYTNNMQLIGNVSLIAALGIQVFWSPKAATAASHFLRGPPGNYDKYRLWDQPSAGPLTYSHYAAVRTIDMMMSSSNLIGIALAFCFGGTGLLIAICVLKMFVNYTWRMTSVQFMPLKPSDQRMMCIVVAAGEMVASRWHELILTWNSPWYYHVYVLLHGSVASIAWHNWEKCDAWNQFVVGISLGVWLLFVITILFLYPYYVWVIRSKEMQHIYLKRAEFMNGLLSKAIERMKNEVDE